MCLYFNCTIRHLRTVYNLHDKFVFVVEGILYSWGRNDYGQLGRLSSNPCAAFDYTPKPVPVTVTKQVVCGSEHSIALLGEM